MNIPGKPFIEPDRVIAFSGYRDVRAQGIDVPLRSVAQSNLHVLDSTRNASSKVHCPTEYVVLLHLHRADVNAARTRIRD
jgi:hypothetical protein